MAKIKTFPDFWKQHQGDCSREEALVIWNAAQEAVEHKVVPHAQREYSEAEIESWNAQGGTFTRDEKARASEWR